MKPRKLRGSADGEVIDGAKQRTRVEADSSGGLMRSLPVQEILHVVVEASQCFLVGCAGGLSETVHDDALRKPHLCVTARKADAGRKLACAGLFNGKSRKTTMYDIQVSEYRLCRREGGRRCY